MGGMGGGVRGGDYGIKSILRISFIENIFDILSYYHTLSEDRKITHDVPQSSILGQRTLFSIYINNPPTTPIVCPLESYVDDSKIYLSFSYKDINVSEIQLTDDLRRIAAWCCSNSPLANPEKTKLLLFGTPQMLNHVQDFRKCYKSLLSEFTKSDSMFTLACGQAL